MYANHIARLKAATEEPHRRIEQLPFFNALKDGTLPVASMIGQLRTFAIHCGTLETVLAESGHRGVCHLWETRTPKMPALLEDLDAYAQQRPDIRTAVDLSLSSVAEIRKNSLDRPASLIGYLYVIEGTTLGNAVHAADAARILGLGENEVPKSYSVYGRNLSDNWQDFSARLNSLELTENEQEEMVDAAVVFFDWLHKIHQALLPYDEKDLFYCSTTINPEAGNHPVPQDPGEIDAAIRAGARCCEMFPYFERRYAERGQRFADSDACWLATLYDLDDHAAEGQARWLAGVLAARGMPSLTLIRQIELLHEELCSVHPEKSERYKTLELVAAKLQNELDETIPVKDFNHLAEKFAEKVPQEELKENPDAGVLLVNAFADEALGRENSVESIIPWLIDAEIFSMQWIAGTEEFISELKETLITKQHKR